MFIDPGIICFRHCHSTHSVFCKKVPYMCPLCKHIISDYVIQPFRVPYPCTNAVYQPTTIVIKPSVGTFLDNYTIQTDLHIGVVTSQGKLIEFDERGLVINDFSKWTDCIAIKLISSSWNAHWDDTLDAMLNDPMWYHKNYNSITMNCFTFVVQFLNNLNYPELRFINKENICKQLILPKIQEILRYISIYRKLQSDDYFISV